MPTQPSWNVQADGYFIVLPEWVEELEISPQAFRLWCRLAKLAGRERSITKRRTRQELADLMGCSVDTVDRWVRELEPTGALLVERDYDPATKRYRPSTYTVITARPVLVEEPADPGRNDAGTPGRTDAAGRNDAANGGRTDADASSPSEKEPSPAAPSSEGAASPSPRSSSSTRAANGPTDAGLTPGGTPANTLPNSAESAEALARRLFEQADRPLGRNVRTVKPVVADLMANGFSVEAIERAALAPTARAWTYEALAYGIRQAETAGQRPGGRLRKAPPPVVQAPTERSEPTADERAEIERIKADLKQKLADKRAAQEAARREQDAAERPTLGTPAEEVHA